MNVECRLLYKFQGGQSTSICQYLPGNTTGMENTHICRHFANLHSCACIFKGSKSNLTGFTNDNIQHWFGGKTCVFYIEVTVFSADLAPKFRCVLNNPVCNLLVCSVTYHNALSSEARTDLISWYFPEVNTNFHDNISVCVEVLWPSQPNGGMLSTVSLPNHTFNG